MRTSLKTYAVVALQNIYPEETIKRFKQICTYKAKAAWIQEISQPNVLRRYINCLDTKFYGCVEDYGKYQRKMFAENDISAGKLKCFALLNKTLLEDIIKQTQDDMLLKYYNILLRLNDGSPVLERAKLYNIAHRLEEKIIRHYDEIEESFNAYDLRNFIIIAALFSDYNYRHSDKIANAFIELVDIFE